MTTEQSKPTALLPCPFCGSTAGDIKLSRGHGYIIGCGTCQGQQFALKRDEAVKLWNTRAHPPAQGEQHVCASVTEAIEASALHLFKAFRKAGNLDMAQAIAHLMEIYYAHDESLIGDATIRLEALAGMADQEWPAIIGGDER